jgi:hypothetical protein
MGIHDSVRDEEEETGTDLDDLDDLAWMAGTWLAMLFVSALAVIVIP